MGDLPSSALCVLKPRRQGRTCSSQSCVPKRCAYGCAVRLDIQGLRALAVVLVVVFHLDPAVVPGGYIGVDVFFVISGFLITGHLLREIDRSGTVRLADFWARRVRRLLPAALLVLVASALAGWVVLPRSVLSQNLTEIGFAAVYALNWRLASDSVDYLAAHNTPSLAQHYWSLSVEEQFYIVWPLLIIAVVFLAAKVGKTTPRAAVMMALAVVFAASLTFSILETARSQSSAYFVTTTRAWEFALGGLIGGAPMLTSRTRWLHPTVSWMALGAIMGSATLFDAQTAFPGWIALVPVVGTGLLLWVGDSTSTWSPQYIARSGPIQFVGDTSYAIYLWHWPLIILVTSHLGRSPGWKWQGLLAVTTVALAAATKYLVEDPVRRAPGPLKRPVPSFAFMAVGMAIVLGVTMVSTKLIRHEEDKYFASIQAAVADKNGCFGAYAITNNCSDPFALTDTVNPAAAMTDDFLVNGVMANPSICTRERVRVVLQSDCKLSTPQRPKRSVVVIGDSHAEQFATQFREIAERNDWALRLLSRAGCSGVMAPEAGTDEARAGCVTWGTAQYASVTADPEVDLVIVAVRTMLYPPHFHQRHAHDRLQALRAAGKAVVAVRMVPGAKNEWPIYASGEKVAECVERAESDDACAWVPPTTADWLADVASDLDIPVIDTWEVMCPDGVCHAVIGGTIAYFDDNHLTTTFAETMVPWLEEQLRRILKRRIPSNGPA